MRKSPETAVFRDFPVDKGEWLVAIEALFVPDREADWRADARCAEIDPELFFPELGGSSKQAKAICAECTVAAQCLRYALETETNHGIFGGLSPNERRALLRERAPRLPRRRRSNPSVCVNGHDLVPANVGFRPDGREYCRTCNRASTQRSRERRMVEAS